ncbi:MAG: polymer-forming cytoskeletal protein [Saprospiraceae bacterium]|nr:polymer-forming cytoskeletal protein [Saprospiraceae bacterium]
MANTTSPNLGGSGINSLVQGTSVEGEITANSDLRVDGKIKGSLISKAKVIIGPSGFVDGKVVCVNAIIEGTFKGNLEVKELLTVTETAKVEGDVFAAKLKVNQGAHFNVSCSMGTHGSPIKNNPKTEKVVKQAVTA